MSERARDAVAAIVQCALGMIVVAPMRTMQRHVVIRSVRPTSSARSDCHG
jgi:hypothetical protein